MPNLSSPSEKEEHYVGRCIPYLIHNEGLTLEQAKGKCFGLYKYFKKKQQSQGSTEEPTFEEYLRDFCFKQGELEGNIEIN